MAIKHEELIELGWRTNVMLRTWRDKTVVIYDDHRWLLNVLFYLRKNNLLVKPDLVFFDAHDDAAQCGRKSDLLSKLNANSLDEASEKQFLSFVEYDISSLDDDWLSVACELDMIGDVVCIGNRYNSNIEDCNGQYSSEDGIVHKMYELSDNLEFELGDRGALGDATKGLEYADIRKFFDSGEHIYKRIGEMNPFILDIDLDCFTLEVKNAPNMAWSETTYFHKYPEYGHAQWFINDLLVKTELITICREPDFCGSLGESNQILELLDNLWFEGSIGTSRVY